MECKHFLLNRERGEEGEYEILILMTNVSNLQINVQYLECGEIGRYPKFNFHHMNIFIRLNKTFSFL